MAAENQQFRLVVRSLLVAAVIIVLLAAAMILLDLLVLAFGAVVIAVLLRALADALASRTPLSAGSAVAVVLVGIALLIAAVTWTFGAHIQSQFSQLAQTLPSAWEALKERIAEMPGGEQIVSSLEQRDGAGTDVLSRLSGIVMSFAAAMLDLLLLIFGAIFIAANPSLYKRGLLKLVPQRRRGVVGDALHESGIAVRQWMAGQLVSMVLVGLLTGVGLWLAGVPSPVALGIIAGVTELIPWLGPFIAAVPILILALTQGPETALLAVAVLLVVQQIESNLIMPYVQKQAVSLPPALTIFGVVAGGLLFGPVGLIFAAPLLVVTFVLVKRLYVEAALGTEAKLPSDG